MRDKWIGRDWINLIILILAGEAIFLLPFVLPRLFRATYLELYAMDNTALGYCFSIYGVVALISYFLGGFLADRFSSKSLMATGLVITALGGYYQATFPPYSHIVLIYGYWGMSTILVFWAAMIKAARVWGGDRHQGKAFGFLDGGRGLVAAGFGSLTVLIIGLLTIKDLEQYSLLEQKAIFKQLLFIISSIIIIVGIIVFVFLNLEGDHERQDIVLKKAHVIQLFKSKKVYLLSIIILTGYSGYKVTDILTQYAEEIMGYDKVASAYIGTGLLYLRPILGVVVGLLADRHRPSLYLLLGFGAMILGSVLIAWGAEEVGMVSMFFISVIGVSIGVYAIRCLYFAVLEEAAIPLELTGTAVGIISVIGYTPDIFMGPIIGYFLDVFEGEIGYRYLFTFIALLGVAGAISTWLISRSRKNGQARGK